LTTEESKNTEGIWWACLIQLTRRTPGWIMEIRSDIMFIKACSEEEAIGKTYKYIDSKEDYKGYSIKIAVCKCPPN